MVRVVRSSLLPGFEGKVIRREINFGPIEEAELLRKMGEEIFSSLPEGWEQVIYRVSAVGGYTNEDLIAVYPDQGSEPLEIPVGTTLKARELRSGMYKEGKGTWFSFEYIIFLPGKFDCNFNYYERPDFDFQPSSRDFLREVSMFPREGEHMPEWLQEEVDRVREA